MVEYRNLGWPFVVVVLSALWIHHLNTSWPPLFLRSVYNCIIIPWILRVIFLLLPSRFSLLSLTLNILTISCVGAAFLYFLIWGHWASCNYKLIYVLNFKKQFIIIFGNIFSVPSSFFFLLMPVGPHSAFYLPLEKLCSFFFDLFLFLPF